MAPARRVARAAAALLLLAVAAAGVEVARPRPHAQKPREHRKKKSGGDPGFDLFIFVRSYSPTFCKQEACTARPM